MFSFGSVSHIAGFVEDFSKSDITIGVNICKVTKLGWAVCADEEFGAVSHGELFAGLQFIVLVA